ncbi:MAG: glutamyl-tRNA reductase [Candidatus Omnitrophica bacterium]|nr:glutamyl-tRNA reductase [Candidatus Omnitrophota bacterium]
MLQFLAYGINHKNCPVEIRETLHFRERRLPEAYEWIRREWPSVETLILSTCNRVELYFVLEEGDLSSETIGDFLTAFHGIERSRFECFAYRLEGRAAIEHLFRVASGLDSMVVGENEILGQLREAFQAAQQAGTMDSLLYRWAERALRVGKLIRTKTKINEGATSIPAVAVELAEKIFGRLGGEKVMVLGTGEMSELALQNLREAGAEALYVMSRNEERGRTLAEAFGARWVSLEDWERFLHEIDILIASTSAPHPIIKLDMVKQVMEKKRHRPLFLIDIAVPRNIEADVNSIDDVYLYNIDDLEEVAQANLRSRRKEVRQAETFIEDTVEEFEAWIQQLEAAPTIERLHAHLDDLIAEEMKRWNSLSREEKERLEEFARRLRSKFLHAPLETLKESSRMGMVRRTLEAIHTLFRLKPKSQSERTDEPLDEIRVSDRNPRQ